MSKSSLVIKKVTKLPKVGLELVWYLFKGNYWFYTPDGNWVNDGPKERQHPPENLKGD